MQFSLDIPIFHIHILLAQIKMANSILRTVWMKCKLRENGWGGGDPLEFNAYYNASVHGLTKSD